MRRFLGMVLVAALLTGGTVACGPESPHALPQDLLARTLDLSREYVSVPSDSTGSDTEAELLARELQREMTASILRRIDAATRVARQ